MLESGESFVLSPDVVNTEHGGNVNISGQSGPSGVHPSVAVQSTKTTQAASAVNEERQKTEVTLVRQSVGGSYAFNLQFLYLFMFCCFP